MAQIEVQVVQTVQIVQPPSSPSPVYTEEERGSKVQFERIGAVERLERFEPRPRSSATSGENHRQLFGRNNFELGIRAVARLLVRAPPAKLRCVTEAVALHVVVSDFDDQFRTQRLPRQVLALAPAALAARHAVRGFAVRWCMLGPIFPRVSAESVLTVGCEEFYQLASLLFCEARADADMLQHAIIVEETEQE